MPDPSDRQFSFPGLVLLRRLEFALQPPRHAVGFQRVLAVTIEALERAQTFPPGGRFKNLSDKRLKRRLPGCLAALGPGGHPAEACLPLGPPPRPSHQRRRLLNFF
jgi:hypothetical protein